MESNWSPYTGDCIHCGKPVNIRNPSGYCDHLYYPDNCKYCKKIVPLVQELIRKFDKVWEKTEGA